VRLFGRLTSRRGRSALQRAVSLHGQFGAFDHRRSDLEQARRGRISRVQRWKPSQGEGSPETLQLLQSLGCDTAGFRSKSWDEFTAAPTFDFVFTVCDNAAAETCPLWPGQPMTAHWGIPDPAQATGSPAEIALAFKDTYRMLNQRIGIFTALPIRSLDQLTLQNKLKDIGRS
jgi:arsenate reductase (thioredoxin)